MISIGKVRDADYYLTETYADDVHRYYADNQRSGTWVGDFAAELGLAEQVDPADFKALLNGVDPRTGARLTSTSVRVHAFDAAISLDKGSSIVRALGDEMTKRQFDQVFEAARDDYVTFLETWAAKVRRGHAGAETHDGSGIAAAVFHHHNSREGDPQEHLHVVILNATRGPDDRITGLDTKLLYQTRYTAEAVFQASFRYHAARTLGLTYGDVDRHGVAQVAGIPDAVRREFSQRRIQIEEAMEARGVSSANAARVAALATRAPKAEPVPDAVMEAQWRSRATDHDFAISDLHTFRRTPGLNVTDRHLAASITENRSHFDHLEAIRQVAIAGGDGAPLAAIEARADDFLASPLVVALTPGRWTTEEILQLERRSVAIATSEAATAPTASRRAIDQAARERPTLGADQAQLLATIAQSTRHVDVVIGKAGAGKTFALDALREAYEQSGHRVIGAALAARAARELQSGAGIKSTTAHSLLAGIEASRITIDASTVVVVDEAAMVPTRTLAALIAEVDRAGAKAILVGDPKQLPEIEAGGLFAAVARRVPAIHLTENRRQTDPHERAALDHLRGGDVDRALDHLHRAGNLVVAPTAEQARNALVDDWYAAHGAQHWPVMVAANRSDVADLNQRARRRLIADGALGQVALEHNATEYRVGDRVLTHHNRYDLGLINGLRGTVAGAKQRGLVVDLADDSRRAVIPHEYLDDGHVTHGYALTIHKAQGMTADQCFVLGDDAIYAEMGYTGLSRGRHANRLYVVASRDEMDRLRDDPVADIRRGLGISRAQTAALDLITPPGGNR